MHYLLDQASKHKNDVAVLSHHHSYTYEELLNASALLAAEILIDKMDLDQARVAYMVSPGFYYIKTQWAIWQAGGVAVPLCISYPAHSLIYVIEHVQAEIIIADKEYQSIIKPIATQRNIRFILLENRNSINKVLPKIDPARNALILFTSGTTNLPKGVVTTHRNIQSQITSLIDAWRWSPSDHILCVLPLHHVHGIINVVSCALYAGAELEFADFDPQKIFDIFLQGEVNVFMAVPTIYFKLISYYENQSYDVRIKISNALSNFRLMVSGSAALPVSVLEKWKQISRHTLLERYGMTEIGMAISNPYDGERKAGYIGKPLPGVQVRLVNEANHTLGENQPGEIQIKGDNVFKEYWNNPDATLKSFTADDWFKTGDIAIVENGYYRIMGRDSIDIIKSGGYKISALEIEEVLRVHPDVKDISIVGVPDDEWGELVAAVIIPINQNLDLSLITTYAREKMPNYKIPRKYKLVDDFPRNAMGKVLKNELKKLF